MGWGSGGAAGASCVARARGRVPAHKFLKLIQDYLVWVLWPYFSYMFSPKFTNHAYFFSKKIQTCTSILVT